MGIPQIIVLVITGISLLFAANGHGKPETGKKNFWVSLVSSCLFIGLLYWGSFFN